MQRPAKVLIVDDTPQNIRLLEAILTPRGYRVLVATSGSEGFRMATSESPDLVLLDLMMPDITGLEVCRRLRADMAASHLPIVMLTSSGEQDKVSAIESGADDYLARPFNQLELLARVNSLLRIKEYHDTIERQAAELSDLNQTLESRVQHQVQELERLGRLRRFLSPQVADVILSSGADAVLSTHRREITVVSSDLRGFTAFAETAEPEDVVGLLAQFHEQMGKIVFQFEGTLEWFAGDGMMTVFNDPLPCQDPTLRAVRMALAMSGRFKELSVHWRKRGYDLELGIGIAAGFATLGPIGFEGRFEYGPVGSVVNLASRLCDEATGGQILLDPRAYSEVEGTFAVEPIEPLSLKGFRKPVSAFNVVAERTDPASLPQLASDR